MYFKAERIRASFTDVEKGKAMPKKETIKPPTKKELSDASKELKKGHPSGGRTMADASVAKRQGVGKKNGK
jgi:hypothetical protein